MFTGLVTFLRMKLNYEVGDPRKGDVVEIYSNVEKANQLLGWKPKFDITDMMSSAWKWELQISRAESKVG